jgi:hypothetical protein
MSPKSVLFNLTPNQRVWTGVSASDVLNRPRKCWWCVSRHGSSGDLLILYQKNVGFVRVEQTTSERKIFEYRCSELGLRTFSTSFSLQFRKPITARDLRRHPILRELPVVRRNFQGTTFQVPSQMWSALRDLIISTKPSTIMDKNSVLEISQTKKKKRKLPPTKTYLTSVSDTDLDFYT